MPNWKKLITSGSDASLNTLTTTGNIVSSGSITALSFTGSLFGTSSYATSASYASTAQTLLGSVTSASFASTASFVNTLNQNVVITGSLGIGTSSPTASLHYGIRPTHQCNLWLCHDVALTAEQRETHSRCRGF